MNPYRFWKDQSPFFLKILLSLPAFAYGMIITLRNLCYEWGFFSVKKLPCPVISVGNISVGGTGKTPATIMLARFLQEFGLRPAILSRGYGRGNKSDRSVLVVGKGKGEDYLSVGDEPLLISRRLPDVPVLVGPSRFLSGKMAIEQWGIDVMILDDGFQHRKLHRDLDIVLIGHELPWPRPKLLPLGNLREPIEAIKRAQIIFFPSGHEENLSLFPFDPCKQFFFPVRLKPLEVKSGTGGSQPLHELSGKKICAFAGIAFPERFISTIEELGGEVVTFLSFPDHHPYRKVDIEMIRKRYAEKSHDMLLTTEKDEMRLLAFPEFHKDLYVLKVDMVPDGCVHELMKVIREFLVNG